MDFLQQCAQSFEKLLDYHYHFSLGKKQTMLEFTLSFAPIDFHHLIGLEKLTDMNNILVGKRSKVFYKILAGELTQEQIEKSDFFPEIAPRLDPFRFLEEFLDSNKIIFRYNPHSPSVTWIKADYLLENSPNEITSYLFLKKRTHDNTQVGVTFFPKLNKDYTSGHALYTLLRKEKINIKTNETILQYNSNSFKTKKNLYVEFCPQDNSSPHYYGYLESMSQENKTATIISNGMPTDVDLGKGILKVIHQV